MTAYIMAMTSPHTQADSTLPLAGIRVLEFCHAIMGPSAGLILADLGADVIKIEPTAGDTTRRLVGFAAGVVQILAGGPGRRRGPGGRG